MAPAGLSRFLTIWFAADAILNGTCGIAYFFFPASFFDGIGGPYGDDVTPNLLWTVRTQASYFALAAGALIVAARSHDPVLRRHLAIAFTVPAIWQIPAAIIRGQQSGGSAVTVAVSCVITAVVCAPYVWYIFVKHEESVKLAWWRNSEPNREDAETHH